MRISFLVVKNISQHSPITKRAINRKKMHKTINKNA